MEVCMFEAQRSRYTGTPWPVAVVILFYHWTILLNFFWSVDFYLAFFIDQGRQKWNGTENIRKFVSKISVYLSRLSFSYGGNLEIPEISCAIWHFYPVWISLDSFNCEKLQDGGESFESTLHWMQKWSAPVRACSWSSILHKKVRIWFPGKLSTGRSELPLDQFARFALLHTLLREKFVSFSYRTCLGRPGKYQGRVYFECV